MECTLSRRELPDKRGTIMEAIGWSNGRLFLLDQRALPIEVSYLDCRNLTIICNAIRTLAVRGAPAIGITAAYGVVVEVRNIIEKKGQCSPEDFEGVLDTLLATRPTAVNLSWAIERMRIVYNDFDGTPSGLIEALEAEAREIHDEDITMCMEMGRHGAELIDDGDGVLTHCNAGALATGGWGTALGVIRSAHAQEKNIHVYADETRPLLQGARLTTWELMQEGIDVTLICDNMAASLMSNGKIQKVVVGSDRTVANGDVCNKIGTLGVAILAKYYEIPFYAALPSSTIDLEIPSGDLIPIEERSTKEVVGYRDTVWAPKGVEVWNPAFDVVPNELVTGIITEEGVVRAPYEENLRKLFG